MSLPPSSNTTNTLELSSSSSSSSYITTTTLHSSSEQGLLLLSSWITRRIQTFLSHTLEPYMMSMMDPSSLRDILDSVLFFAISMKRVGADFTSLLPSIFQSHLVRIITHYWREGLHQLEETLKVCRDAGKASPLQDLSIISSVVVEEEEDTTKTPLSMDPPKKILSYPPLARLINVYLSSLNDLRRFLLMGCILPLRTYLHTEYLIQIDQVLQENERFVMTPGFLQGKGDGAKNLRSCASGMKDLFHTCMHGYMIDALEISFGVIPVAKPNKNSSSSRHGVEEIGPEQVEKEEVEEEKEEESVTIKIENDKEEGENSEEVEIPKNVNEYPQDPVHP